VFDSINTIHEFHTKRHERTPPQGLCRAVFVNGLESEEPSATLSSRLDVSCSRAVWICNTISFRSFISPGDLSLSVNKAAAISLLSSWDIAIVVTGACPKSDYGIELMLLLGCYSDVNSVLISTRIEKR